MPRKQQAAESPAIYYRVSTTMQADHNGVDSQKLAVEQWMAAYGVKPARVYTDLAKSGGTMNRPAFRQMLAAIRRGDHDMVVAYDMSRIGRSLIELLEFTRELKERKVRLVFVKEGIVTDGATGNLMLSVMGAVAEYQREKTRENAVAGVAAARAKNPLWGMGRVPKHLRPVPKNKIASDDKVQRLITRIEAMEPTDRAQYIRKKADEWGMTESGLRSRVQRAGG